MASSFGYLVIETDHCYLLTDAFTRRGCYHYTESPREAFELAFRHAPPEEQCLTSGGAGTIHYQGIRRIGQTF